MSHKPVEFIDYHTFKEKKIEGNVEGLFERVISGSKEGKKLVRVMEFKPGTDTTPNGVQAHDYWEEVYIIKGSFVDLTLNEEFTEGMVASRPPGMKHGPWQSANGCTLLEVRYYLDD